MHPAQPHRLRKIRGASTLDVQKLYSLYSCIKIIQPLFRLERLQRLRKAHQSLSSLSSLHPSFKVLMSARYIIIQDMGRGRLLQRLK